MPIRIQKRFCDDCSYEYPNIFIIQACPKCSSVRASLRVVEEPLAQPWKLTEEDKIFLKVQRIKPE